MDGVDKILQQWQQARPDLDCSSMGVVGRIRRAANFWEQVHGQVCGDAGISAIEFDILATLRRSIDPVTPTKLYKTLMISSGAVSTRLEGLVQKGWVHRVASESDRRSNRVTLTEDGVAFLDQVLEAHVASMEQHLTCLDSEERSALESLLSKFLRAEVE
ncbi:MULTISPECIES: MarR family winged helix-turn-helix transcriptional regulator [Vibrio]|uniref:MarR family winged helix-turn-helix transcriptional regulator n=1 Tax=Vibrio TaxID=662 RepID=UPI001A9078C2|nr:MULTISPECIES: MarR family transcriptional regulator [Vibrio]ELA8177376.1 MarR family transcriptional regulator [Vibrio alginolyticus]ELB2849072.1 MarR family transcriptional regulator [Vibrio alginolyticus]MBO0139095.1 MarR family transcriptional regulator [Vibrio sp. Vb2736]MBS9824644.1 MarR family transcriptional regulator [Vibrio alginolyticus]MBS9902672.1 MarR family transcriptional regulator [Vibrio alginolyticus]